MSKNIETICDSCESEFSLNFNENLVQEHDKIYCPFCNAVIDEVLEEDQDYDVDEFSLYDED